MRQPVAVEADRADGQAAKEPPPAVHILLDVSAERSSGKLEEAAGLVVELAGGRLREELVGADFLRVPSSVRSSGRRNHGNLGTGGMSKNHYYVASWLQV